MIGQILWISKRDGNGILLAEQNNKQFEVYFDSSTFKDFNNASPKDMVSFDPAITGGCNCAKNVKLNNIEVQPSEAVQQLINEYATKL